MNAVEFWKTNLYKELAISGSYLYNGLKSFDEMDTFYYEGEVFEFLYAISVGIERLQKIAVILKEETPSNKQKEFENSLKTHNHFELMKRIKKTEQNDISSLSYDFLQLLTTFYKSCRYDRFSLSGFSKNDMDCLPNSSPYSKEKEAFIFFMEQHLKVTINNDPLTVTRNNKEYKNFIGNIVGEIVEYLYDIIKHESTRLNIYTYEISLNTKAYKIFIRKEYDFINEDIFWKELLIYILNNVDNEYLQLYKSIEPLEFDEGILVSMIKSLKSDLLKQEHLDNLECLYEDVKNPQKRFAFLDIIGDEMVYMNEDEENNDISINQSFYLDFEDDK